MAEEPNVSAEGKLDLTAEKREQYDDEPVQDAGIPRMTPEFLRDCCLKNSGWSSPELNDVLMLQYKGFRKIEGLQEYRNVKSLFLECNGIRRLENIEVMPKLMSLYLQSNCIFRLENLSALKGLVYLNLARNNITDVENLEQLVNLETLNLSSNKITQVQALEGLRARRDSLRSVDLSANYIEDGDALIDFWPTALPDLTCLYLHHNPCSRNMKDYRRRVISKLQQLRWLDERIVPEVERIGCRAWSVGGKEAENKAKADFWLAERGEKEKSFSDYQRVTAAVVERAKAQQRDDGQHTEAVARPHAHAQKFGELQRQAELSAKVQAFLAQRTRRQGTPVEGHVLVAEDVAAGAEDAAESEASTEAPQELTEEALASRDDATSNAPTGAPTERSSIPDENPAFEWTAFRDKRLGRLVAEHRYNFSRAAEALGKEFGAPVAVDICRARYKELARPRFAPAARGGGSLETIKEALAADLRQQQGRARDSPAPSLEVTQEIQSWWLRSIAGVSSSRTMAVKANHPETTQDVDAKVASVSALSFETGEAATAGAPAPPNCAPIQDGLPHDQIKQTLRAICGDLTPSNASPIAEAERFRDNVAVAASQSESASVSIGPAFSADSQVGRKLASTDAACLHDLD